MLLKEFEKRWLAVFAEGISKKRLAECMRYGHYNWCGPYFCRKK